jgi:hypothetical protein
MRTSVPMPLTPSGAGLVRGQRHIRSMPTIDLDEDELDAVAAALRNAIGRYRHAPRLAPLKSALAKLDPVSTPAPPIERPPILTAPMRSRGGKPVRRLGR